MKPLSLGPAVLALALVVAPAAAPAQTAATTQAETATAVPPAVRDLLADGRAADDLSQRELNRRIRALRAAIDSGDLPPDVLRQLRDRLRADRAVKKSGRAAAQQSAGADDTGASGGQSKNKEQRKAARNKKKGGGKAKDGARKGGAGACTLTATPAQAAPGDAIALSWTVVEGYDSGRIRQGNTVLSEAPAVPAGTLTATAPSEPSTYQYLMLVAGDTGADTCEATVTVGATDRRDVLFDLTPATLAPAETPKQITVIGTQTDESKGGKRSTSACVLTYRMQNGKVVADWKVLSPEQTTNAVLKEEAWRIVNHHGNTQLCYPDSRPAVIAAGDRLVKLSAEGADGGVAHALTFASDAVTMRARQTELAVQFFGIPYFYKGAKGREERIARKEIKLGQYLDRRYARRSLGDYSALTLTFDATPRTLDYVFPPADAADPPFVDRKRSTASVICVTGKPTKNAEFGQACIDADDSGGSKFRIANLDFQWRDPRCAGKKDTAKNAFCAHSGKSLGFTIAIADARYDFIDDDPDFDEITQDPESRVWLYRFSVRNLMPPGTTRNPFKIVGQRTRISGDLLRPMQQAILYAERSNPPACASDPEQCYSPPRLKKDTGEWESDAEYFGHFSIANGQIGYEATALSDLTFEVHNFSLIGTRKAK